MLRMVLLLLTTGALLLPESASGQTQTQRAVRTFTFDCANPQVLQSANLDARDRRALARFADGEPGDWGDRAVATDLNGDNSAELFVPLSCGATCNCTWAIFQKSTSRMLGYVDGCVINIRPNPGAWATVLAYSHMSAADGVIQSYSFAKGAYRGSIPKDITWSEASQKLGCDSRDACCK
jgi:hypothetical protein